MRESWEGCFISRGNRFQRASRSRRMDLGRPKTTITTSSSSSSALDMAICGRLLQKPVNQLFWDPVRKHVFKLKKKQSLGEEFGFPLVSLLHVASSFFLSAQAAHGSILLILKAERTFYRWCWHWKGGRLLTWPTPSVGRSSTLTLTVVLFTVPHFNDLQVPFPSIFVSVFHTFQHTLWSDDLVKSWT